LLILGLHFLELDLQMIFRGLDLKGTAGVALIRCFAYLLLPPSQNICTFWLRRFIFDHSSYLKKIVNYYLFCYDMFYHLIYFRYIIIVFTFSQFFWIRRMVKCNM
jgi:hypothetical protein